MSILLCFIFLLTLFIIFLKNLKPSKWKLPPGPKTRPITGNLHNLQGALPLCLQNLSQKYGPVMLLRFGFVPKVIITSKEAAEEVLRIQDLQCCSRPKTAGFRMVSYNCKDIGFAPYGEEWRTIRKISVVELFTAKKIQSFTHIREEENDLLVKKLSESSLTRPTVNLKKTLYTLVASIVCRVGFGLNLHECEFMNEDSVTDVMNKMDLVQTVPLYSDTYPGRMGRFVDWISGQKKRSGNYFSDVNTFNQNILDDHLKPGRRVEESSDIIDVMIDMMRKQDEDKDGDSFKLTTDHLRAMIGGIFLAGVSTSASTMIWAMTELIRNPRVMKKVQEEIRTTLGDKKERVTEEDVTKLHYFKLIVKETLRLHLPAPFLLPRETLSDIKIQGYDIPAKTQILINAYAIARDPKYWENPDEFNPDRFLDSSKDYKGLHFEFIPFGSGRRVCPGMGTAITIMELGLLNLLYFFDWGLPEKEEGDDIITRNEVALDLVQVIPH
ncbi:unnamed protein product [Microthlaspi erraticum]|uniref:Cytochrome P450 n=1 Tax=Microthlaspi erraticum TaxID=1685480 RepID=A0A6D2JCD2_9BRAS|nr:unnamed protein product [Microthlaspi erraticum]